MNRTSIFALAAAVLITAGIGVAVWGIAAGGLQGSPTPAAEISPTPQMTVATQVPSPAAPSAEVESVDQGPAALDLATLASPEWVEQTSASSAIPARVLAAYGGATLVAANEYPACQLDWAVLAGIGWVESHHGSYQGRTITDEGIQSPALVGIALDGSSSLAVRDTDGGTLDGDDVWDRAVGPMQFIPDTWAQFGSDGNGDGFADPQQIDDAALTAARYLCATGGDLSTSQGWIAAVAAYNPSVDYNNLVAQATNAYRSGTRPQ